MRLKDLTAAHHKLLRDLSGRISNRLEAVFTELPGPDGPSIGIELRERGKRVEMTVPETLLLHAGDEPAAREDVRVRIKARRDRMLFRPGARPLPKKIAAMPPPSGSFGAGRGPGRRW